MKRLNPYLKIITLHKVKGTIGTLAQYPRVVYYNDNDLINNFPKYHKEFNYTGYFDYFYSKIRYCNSKRNLIVYVKGYENFLDKAIFSIENYKGYYKKSSVKYVRIRITK